MELVAIESADPRWIAQRMGELLDHVHRVRAMGTIAVSLCQVALTRVDGMATLWKTRSVDAAAAQLIVRESGGVVAFPGCETPLASALDLDPVGPVVAARSQEDLDRLAEVVSAP
jgi:myo-inositol-1(or 4)-monophosphatase